MNRATTAIKMTEAQTTETLVQSFEHTDTILDQGNLSEDDYAAIATSRGWIIEVLDGRNALHLIGF